VNLEAPRCRRCDGRRFFHVRRMRDASLSYEDSRRIVEWRDRPVRASTGTEGEPIALGHFETLICRRCGFTAWYAFDWTPAPTPLSPEPCAECAAPTPHARLPAVEHGGYRFEEVRITHGLLGREGFLSLSICTGCGGCSWSGRDYAHLEPRHFVRYRVCDEPDRACMRCGAHAAIVDDAAREYDGFEIPIALREHGLLHRVLGIARRIGGFQLRLCRPCGGVEWYARGLDDIDATEPLGIALIGEEPERSSMGGPYR